MMPAILYTFKRCPYAIRARMGLEVAGITVDKIEVDLKCKPPEMLAVSAKGTVPVLILPDGRVLEESLDIMMYSLKQSDPEHWLPADTEKTESDALIMQNDTAFKRLLDKYKYHVRHTEYSQAQHRAHGEEILAQLESRLARHRFLLGDCMRMTDIAIFPFIRQWAGVENANMKAFPRLSAWLEFHLASRVFRSVM
jgi:glutathione S-transferase